MDQNQHKGNSITLNMFPLVFFFLKIPPSLIILHFSHHLFTSKVAMN